MIRRQILGMLLITCFCLSVMPLALCANDTITVNPISGANAQIEINKAINSAALYATATNPVCVRLAAGTYEISAPINLKSNVALKGSGENTIIFAIGSVCNSGKSPAYVYGLGVSNVEVSDLQFKSTAKGPVDGGHGQYRICIKFTSSRDTKVHDILFTSYLYNDGVRISKSTNINVYNCKMHSVGHDGVAFLADSKNCRMYNCDVWVQTNTGVRIDNSINCEVDHNTFSGSARSGWCCIEVQNACKGLNIHHNILHDYKGSSNSAGIGNVKSSGAINVRDNVMWAVKPYSQIKIGANILGSEDHNVDNWVAKGYGYGSM